MDRDGVWAVDERRDGVVWRCRRRGKAKAQLTVCDGVCGLGFVVHATRRGRRQEDGMRRAAFSVDSRDHDRRERVNSRRRMAIRGSSGNGLGPVRYRRRGGAGFDGACP